MPEHAVSPSAPAAPAPAPAPKPRILAQKPVAPPMEAASKAEVTTASGPTALSTMVLQRKMVVGASDDVYEREADAVAERVVAAIRRGDDTGGASDVQRSHGVPTAQRTRIARMAATIGAEGGAVDHDTERDISAARSGGKPLDVGVRRSMEGAIGADFSNIRVHVGAKSDQLNERIQAKAFTTGSDVFVRRSDYAPSTTAGQKLLAHELTHTVQQGASPRISRKLNVDQDRPTVRKASDPVVSAVQRSTQMIQRWDWWDKRQAAKADKDKRKQMDASANAAEAYFMEPMPADSPGAKAFTGKAGNLTSTAGEIGKPAAALGIAGGVAGGIAGGLGNIGYAGGVGSGVLAPVTGIDAALGLISANNMDNDATKFGDKGMGYLAGRKAKEQSQVLGASMVGASKAGVDIANVAGNTAKDLGGNVLGVAGGALGIAGGSAMVLQGGWRGGQAVMKLCRLAWGRSKEMVSAEGARWKEVIVGAEKFKVAINALKIAAGVLGIAAGALLIVSNPVGWAIGIAAAIAGGVFAVGKIAAKIKNASDKGDARKRIEASKKGEDVDLKTAGEVDRTKGRGKGFSTDEVASPPVDRREAAARKKAIEDANLIAREGSKNARVADEMRGALGHGSRPFVQTLLDQKVANPKMALKDRMNDNEDRKLHDAWMLLSSINIDPEVAISESGQDAIEKKLSKAEAM